MLSKNFITKLLIIFSIFAKYNTQKALSVERIFDQYGRSFNKKYLSSSEKKFRLNVFNQNLKNIRAFNSDINNSYQQEVNDFTDLTFEEFSSRYLMKEPLKNFSTSDENLLENSCKDKEDCAKNNLKFKFNCFLDSIDWREKAGSIQPIKNQNECGSCYTFSALASLENAIWNKTGESVSLSEQELVDCTTEFGNGGCDGGWMDNAYDYIIKNGVALNSKYRYRNRKYNCSRTRKRRQPRYGMSFKRKFADRFSQNNVEQLQTLACSGVVAVAFEVRNGFQNFRGGLYRSPSPSCGSSLNHAVNVVGFNKSGDFESNYTPYFIIRNSWGTIWGDNGYAKVEMGTGDGTCGIASYIGATLPIV
jgi:cathepsin L